MAALIVGIFLIVWGAAAALIGLLRPARIWQLGKLQGFVKLLGETGAMILVTALGIVAIVVGILIL